MGSIGSTILVLLLLCQWHKSLSFRGTISPLQIQFCTAENCRQRRRIKLGATSQSSSTDAPTQIEEW